MTPLMWVAALVVVGLAALALEVFVPSGGVLGFLSVVALVAGVALAFVELGPWFGTAVLAVTCLAVPLVLAVAGAGVLGRDDDEPPRLLVVVLDAAAAVVAVAEAAAAALSSSSMSSCSRPCMSLIFCSMSPLSLSSSLCII